MIHTHQASSSEFPFKAKAVYIRQENADCPTAYQAMVTSYSGGSDTWYNLPDNFADPTTSLWTRDGWEIAAIRATDDPNTNHVGVAVLGNTDNAVYVTVRDLNIIDVVRVTA